MKQLGWGWEAVVRGREVKQANRGEKMAGGS